jgi:N-ethylmaleimide reductase
MAPMTRCRAIDNIPNELMAEYYKQRSNAGLIITEGTSPSPNGLGYARIPGIFSKVQVEGGKKQPKPFMKTVENNYSINALRNKSSVEHACRIKFLSSSSESCWTNVDRLERLTRFSVPKEMTEQDILHAKLNMWLQLKMPYLQDLMVSNCMVPTGIC